MSLQRAREKNIEVIAKAQQLYGLDLSRVQIRYDLKGRTAGQACRRGGFYFVRYNHDMLSRNDKATEHVINDTIPHEWAHIVCYMKPTLGSNHDYGWQRVCIALGGSGERLHQEEVVFGKGLTFEYTTDYGYKVRVSETHHKRLQSGRHQWLSWKSKGKITAASPYIIVGQMGRTLATPKVPVPHTVPRVTPMVPAVTVSEAGKALMGWKTPVPAYVPATHPAPVAHAPLVDGSSGSKAHISRQIMQRGHAQGLSQEQIIQQMIAANGYTRQLARATYKANAVRAGVPQLI